MKHHSVIVNIGSREYRKYPVALSPEPKVDQIFMIGGNALCIVRVDGFDVLLSTVPYDNKLIDTAEKEGFFRSN